MHKTKEQLYTQIKDLKSEKEFKGEIKELQKEYDDLFDDWLEDYYSMMGDD